MKYISTFLFHLRPMQMFVSVLLVAVMFFTSGCNGESAKNTTAKAVQIENIKRGYPPVAKSDSTDGTVQLDKIEQNTEKALNAPATSLKTIEKRSQGALNEVQSAADRNKMSNSNNSK
jgi:expansin (peptidoglycan-binding protein)